MATTFRFGIPAVYATIQIFAIAAIAAAQSQSPSTAQVPAGKTEHNFKDRLKPNDIKKALNNASKEAGVKLDWETTNDNKSMYVFAKIPEKLAQAIDKKEIDLTALIGSPAFGLGSVDSNGTKRAKGAAGLVFGGIGPIGTRAIGQGVQGNQVPTIQVKWFGAGPDDGVYPEDIAAFKANAVKLKPNLEQ
jgi:hypothetical protein